MATDYRARLLLLMRQTVADESAHLTWSYREVRPMPVPASWHAGQRVVGDCSKGVQYLCKWAGCKDPMQEEYGPYGNSQTLWLRLQHLARATELEVGDIVTFGRDGDEHATMVCEGGADPLLWSFGRQGAPELYRLSQDRRPAQFCRNPLPIFTPTPADKLRAQTGWFAWVGWKLGEGGWRTYGQADPKVRPNVPSRIPLSWWARYAKFLKNRKGGG